MMVRIRDMEHGRCGQVIAWGNTDPRVNIRLAPVYCSCPGYESQDSLGLGAVCKHCGHLRIQHNRRMGASAAPEVKDVNHG